MRYGRAMDDVVVDADGELLERLRAGDEDAFMTLVDRYGPLMLRIALTHVRTRAVAEEVVQEAWLGVLQGLDRFEGRSSLKTWILRIVANRARTRGAREVRSVPLSSLGPDEGEDEPAVDPDRFLGPEHPRYPGGWAIPPHSWARMPEERLLAAETLQEVRAAIAAYLDGALSPEESERMQAHLELCGPCAAYVEQLRTTARLAAAATAELHLRPDRSALLRAFGEFQRGRPANQ
jgi:RNA polymerase sigma-70 factor (ECF subfamily)